MQDAGRVRHRESVANTDEHLDDLTPGPAFRVCPSLQRAAIDEFGDQVLLTLELADIVDREDVGMIQRRHRLGLALETPSRGRVGPFISEEFDRGGTIELRVECAVHDPHATVANEGDDFIRAEMGARTKRHAGGPSES